ncbi:hypothetical protein BU198_37705, partial [Streptomyces sp. CBMA156]|nr:hypothetical protein [Streptomyces sp. CBMA156]
MKWDAWGDPALAKELSADIKGLLAAALGVTGDAAPGPSAEEVVLRPSRISAEDLKALADAVGEAHVSAADADRLPRAGGK